MEDEERVKAIAKGKFTIEEFLVQVESIGKPGMLSLVKKSCHNQQNCLVNGNKNL
jgi:signal recognition particle GTPase